MQKDLTQETANLFGMKSIGTTSITKTLVQVPYGGVINFGFLLLPILF